MRAPLILTSIILVSSAAAASAQNLGPMSSGPMVWSGPYAGVQLGMAGATVSQSTNHPTFSTSNSAKETNFILGAHAGVNGQIGHFVFGGEIDVERTGTSRSFRTTVATGNFSGEVKAPWISTLRLRAGLGVDRFLIYGTAGMAVTQASAQAAAAAFSNNVSNYFAGMAVGAGVEYAFTNHITARVEYRHINFAQKTFSFSGADTSKVDLSVNALRIGASLKF